MLMRLMLEALLGTMHDVDVRTTLAEWSCVLSPSLRSCVSTAVQADCQCCFVGSCTS